jgi:hypothetical protein
MECWSNGLAGEQVASRGGFTRQPVNVACFEALTKVRPVRSPVRSRQEAVRSLSAIVCTRSWSVAVLALLFRMSLAVPTFNHTREPKS